MTHEELKQNAMMEEAIASAELATPSKEWREIKMTEEELEAEGEYPDPFESHLPPEIENQ